jgi:hypothetical protein
MLHSYVDRFAFFDGLIDLRGWAYDDDNPVTLIALHIGDLSLVADRYEHPVAAGQAGFSLKRLLPIDSVAMMQQHPWLEIVHADRMTTEIHHPGVLESSQQHGMNAYNRYLEELRRRPPGNFLEIGGRARSGHVRKDHVPPGWEYTSMDIMAGENVDVVGDAHQMSRLLPHNHYHAAMSVSVFEHLLMPWKAVIELNRVMAPGGIVFIMTHQAYPLHDQPCDYWRISKDAWPALFNAATGFRIIEAADGERLFMVAERWHPIANHAEHPGMAVSTVTAEKIGEATVDWPVDLTGEAYPA